MNDETDQWLSYAEENLQSAELLLEHHLWNPCLQNAQQAVEKFLKALMIECAIPLKRTHSINELVRILADRGIESGLTEDQCDLLDSIYLPTKYPLGSALPHFAPDEEVSRNCVQIAKRVAERVRQLADQFRISVKHDGSH
jgi:HEPN domain-containing protein